MRCSRQLAGLLQLSSHSVVLLGSVVVVVVAELSRNSMVLVAALLLKTRALGPHGRLRVAGRTLFPRPAAGQFASPRVGGDRSHVPQKAHPWLLAVFCRFWVTKGLPFVPSVPNLPRRSSPGLPCHLLPTPSPREALCLCLGRRP